MTTLRNPNIRLMVAAICSAVLLAGCAAETTSDTAEEEVRTTVSDSFVEPEIQMVGPVIYLADNLNEKEKLGWCIDTEGKGQGDQLQAHSCKPAGDDTQYSYDISTSTIRSVNYDNQCMSFNDPENAVNPLGLVDCLDDDPKQQFAYDSDNMEIRIGDDPSQCVTVAETIVEAGPYQSRDLLVASCQDLSANFKQWVVRY